MFQNKKQDQPGLYERLGLVATATALTAIGSLSGPALEAGAIQPAAGVSLPSQNPKEDLTKEILRLAGRIDDQETIDPHDIETYVANFSKYLAESTNARTEFLDVIRKVFAQSNQQQRKFLFDAVIQTITPQTSEQLGKFTAEEREKLYQFIGFAYRQSSKTLSLHQHIAEEAHTLLACASADSSPSAGAEAKIVAYFLQGRFKNPAERASVYFDTQVNSIEGLENEAVLVQRAVELYNAAEGGDRSTIKSSLEKLSAESFSPKRDLGIHPNLQLRKFVVKALLHEGVAPDLVAADTPALLARSLFAPSIVKGDKVYAYDVLRVLEKLGIERLPQGDLDKLYDFCAHEAECDNSSTARHAEQLKRSIDALRKERSLQSSGK